MNKKLNAFLRILTVVAAAAAAVFAFLLKGKMDAALKNTAWAVADPEVKAGKEYDARMLSLSTLPALLDGKRKAIVELETTKTDLLKKVESMDKKITEQAAANTTLEGERAELTRKRDELAAQLTDANSKKDGAEAALATTKEELAKTTEKVAGMFTKEQLAENEAKATMAEQKAEQIRSKYAALHAKISRAMDNNPAPFGFASDPLAEPVKPGDTAPAVAATTDPVSDTILTSVLALDTDTGIVAFSVGETNGIKAKDIFDVKIEGKKVGKVQISSVKGPLSFGQFKPDKELDLRAVSKATAVSLAPSIKSISAN